MREERFNIEEKGSKFVVHQRLQLKMERSGKESCGNRRTERSKATEKSFQTE